MLYKYQIYEYLISICYHHGFVTFVKVKDILNTKKHSKSHPYFKAHLNVVKDNIFRERLHSVIYNLPS